MPEGHTIHRYASLHRKALAGRRLSACSPQGRFAEGAARLDGSRLRAVEAYGKHLFYRWQLPEPATLHVHLGLFGHFRNFEPGAGPAPPPTAGTRLQLMRADGYVLRLAGPTICRLITPAQRDAVLARLGPDPLRRDGDPQRMHAALRRRGVGIGQALLDQGVVAGIGNVYRAEALFLAGIDPQRPARDLDHQEVEALWASLVKLLRRGRRTGRIVTIEATDRSVPASRLPRSETLYVYGRAGQPCRRCGTAIRAWTLGGRTVSACPACQPR